MFTLRSPNPASARGVLRRDCLRIGGLGLCGLTLADVLRSDAAAGAARRTKSVIYIVLNGGPSHIDMWDLKPHAPTEYRGPFQPIATSLPGVEICEHMPRQAALMDRLALLRGIRSVENDHYLSEVYTGLPRTSGARPAFGSVVSRAAAAPGLLPYVSLSAVQSPPFEYENPHYAGAGHAPFRPFEEAVEDLSPPADRAAFENRRQLLRSLDRLLPEESCAELFRGTDRFQARALEMLMSSRVRDALDVSQEPEETLRRYGHRAGQYPHQTVKSILYDWDAKPFVQARRLVEAGVRVVTLQVAAWDHHSGPESDIFFALRRLMPLLDVSFTALCEDLDERGLTDDVLVVMLGEFGRTPRISELGPGREHWADAGCAVLFGGGLKTGQVIGRTDARAERSIEGRTTFQSVLATIYTVLGIDPASTLPDFQGRPQLLLDDPDPIRELV
ncbi:MAG: DUF1501 domain-containing protein [Planctomyces sp.]|nr:DUF1501 domain-containing protein [Planctomyces sp.]